MSMILYSKDAGWHELVALGWIDGNQTVIALMGCGLLACVGSAVWVWMRSVPVHAWHVGAQLFNVHGTELAQLESNATRVRSLLRSLYVDVPACDSYL